MSKHERVKSYYERGLWNETMVKNAVKKKWITEEQMNEILGEDDENDNSGDNNGAV